MILQIIGYKNSGKTTLMTHAVKFLKLHGFCVATIKHHGQHDLNLSDIELQTDTVDHMKHFNAGADQSIVQGHHLQQTVTRIENQRLDEIIDKSVTIDSDIILVEGFKEANYDKVLIYRDNADYQQLNKLSNIQYDINIEQPLALQKFEQWLLSFVNEKGMD
ncbi:molybdopterin-guanine dinucleotide biosynthesis protein B [Staphylococcus cohnii]|uniref:molybdopterin-guanine dinucleotide biosynthesis protein B n=1 Tax=Staphylococcus TaxID=1279 RepID=UPI000E6A091D|nr:MULTISPECIES: molybdopterin-guanine dinucleotide biosynthesis protein B [Staphylococcus]MCE5098548.1 molybdopterin-guanine dinucleotide biosynthesis protein B [Staphylococcus cohnii]MSU29584.1 molybdopterin-guanine dinucleotide biosynthesis protein B [Staphylococcus sp. McC-251-APC-3A2]RIL76170.1 molybdopterin-guanine dinucleotide biosynthesis protein B [Staphylococcus cohnii]